MEQNFKELPQPSFGEAVKKNLSSLTDFKGRSRRSELWWNVLLYCIVGLASLIFLGAFPVARSIVSIVVQIVLLAAVTTRRLHDRGQSGLWVLAAFIIGIVEQVLIQQSGFYEIADSLNPNPEKILEIVSRPELIVTLVLDFIVNITIFVFCLLDSKPEANKYGPSPKYVIEGQE